MVFGGGDCGIGESIDPPDLLCTLGLARPPHFSTQWYIEKQLIKGGRSNACRTPSSSTRVVGPNARSLRFVSAGNTRGAAAWQTIEEYDEATQMLSTSLVYGSYIDEAISMRKDIDGAGTTHHVEDFYFHADDLFNVVLVTDAAGAGVELAGVDWRGWIR